MVKGSTRSLGRPWPWMQGIQQPWLESDNDTNDDLTREILSKLVKSRRIPTHVVAALSPYFYN